MKARFALLTLMAPLLAACATSWSKPGGTQAELQTDQLACTYEAKKATGSASMGTYGDAAAAGWRQGEIETLCMQTKGYGRQRN